MPHHDPAIKGIAQLVPGVTAQKLPDPVLLQGLVGIDGRVGEGISPGPHRVGELIQKGKLRRKARGKQALEGLKIRQLQRVKVQLQGHVPQQAALSAAQIALQIFLPVGVHGENGGPVVAVAHDGDHVPLLRHGHDFPQSPEALGAFFKEVPVQDQEIVAAKADLSEQAVEIR